MDTGDRKPNSCDISSHLWTIFMVIYNIFCVAICCVIEEPTDETTDDEISIEVDLVTTV